MLTIGLFVLALGALVYALRTAEVRRLLTSIAVYLEALAARERVQVETSEHARSNGDDLHPEVIRLAERESEQWAVQDVISYARQLYGETGNWDDVLAKLRRT